jgi:hypothetical protein
MMYEGFGDTPGSSSPTARDEVTGWPPTWQLALALAMPRYAPTEIEMTVRGEPVHQRPW